MSSYLDRCFRSFDGQRLITAHLIKRFQDFIFFFRFKQRHVNCNQFLNWLHDQWATELRIHSSLLWISCLIRSISWSVSPSLHHPMKRQFIQMAYSIKFNFVRLQNVYLCILLHVIQYVILCRNKTENFRHQINKPTEIFMATDFGRIPKLGGFQASVSDYQLRISICNTCYEERFAQLEVFTLGL